MNDYTTAGRGLNKMFYGQILCILGFLPLVGWIAAIVGLILFLVGLNEAGRADAGYRTAFLVTIANLVVSLLSGVLGILSIVSDILAIAAVYLVCITTANLLFSKGDPATAGRGLFVWKLYAACMVVEIICAALALIPLINLLAWVVLVITAIMSLVGGILYLMFLYRASKSLQY